LKQEGVGPVEHTDRFYYWLCSIKMPGGHRAGTVKAIVEKMNTLFNGLYDGDAYGELDKEEA
jgi:hypothetical protein